MILKISLFFSVSSVISVVNFLRDRF